MITFSVFPEETVIVEDSPYGVQAAEGTSSHVMKVSCAKDVVFENVIPFIQSKE
jgi:beta-phosphoglucomutase-like phosphatase (HAD superfamily)